MYLNRAEGYIRKYMAGGDASCCQKALNDLNELRRHRFNNVEYTYEEVNITDRMICLNSIRRNGVGSWPETGCIAGVI